jgi:hypothetical protein
MKKIIYFSILTFAFSLQSTPVNISSIPVPNGYTRVNYERSSFSNYVQHLPLKSENRIFSHQNKDLTHWYESLGVIDKPLLFKDDLEQCADFTMRLWADYHKESGKLSTLFLFNYSGSKVYFKDSHLSYEKFLRKAFASSNSHSMKVGAKKISSAELVPGDLFVQNETGGIGHVSMILDHAKSPSKPDLYLIAFSFMPAQEMHIEKAPANLGRQFWFEYQGFLNHLAEKYPYGKPVLRRF